MSKRLYRGFRANREYQKMINYIQKNLLQVDRAKVIREAIEELYEGFKNGKNKNYNI